MQVQIDAQLRLQPPRNVGDRNGSYQQKNRAPRRGVTARPASTNDGNWTRPAQGNTDAEGLAVQERTAHPHDEPLTQVHISADINDDRAARSGLLGAVLIVRSDIERPARVNVRRKLHAARAQLQTYADTERHAEQA